MRGYYNLNDPQNAMLALGVDQQALLPLAIPLVFLTVGTVVLLSLGG